MYAIAFDLDTEVLKRNYGTENWRHGYECIRRVLEVHGFKRKQGSLYFGHELTTPVNCVLAVQDIRERYSWFHAAVRDIRMLRIEEDNDLFPAIETRGSLGFKTDTPAA